MTKPTFLDRLQALAALLVLSMNTLLCFIPLMGLGIVKFLPIHSLRILCMHAADGIVQFWISINSFFIRNFIKTTWHIDGLTKLSKKEWYVLVCNHQSAVDIVVLQHVFNGRIPVFKFFLKDALKWVPLLGISWWALGYPFMKRYSKAYLEKKPHKRGRDLETTQKAMALFEKTPSTITNYVEGTRFSKSKHAAQQSPYTCLLKPKAGGVSYAIGTMPDKIHLLLDVSIVYSGEQHGLWAFLCQQIKTIRVDIQTIEIPIEFRAKALLNDAHLQENFRQWLNQIWHEKDQRIAAMRLLNS